MDAIKRIELRFGSIQKPHAAGIAGIINQVMKPIGPQLRQRLLKGADKPSKVPVSPALKGSAIAREP
jgi:hypothetical protein